MDGMTRIPPEFRLISIDSNSLKPACHPAFPEKVLDAFRPDAIDVVVSFSLKPKSIFAILSHRKSEFLLAQLTPSFGIRGSNLGAHINIIQLIGWAYRSC